jgi:hypothetical protein
MSSGANNIETFLSTITLMKGKSAWKPIRTHGSMFILDVGLPVRSPRDAKDHGEFSIIFELCRWRFGNKEQEIINNNSNINIIDNIFENMILSYVDGVQLNSDKISLKIFFSSGIALEAATNKGCELEDQWIFYGPNKKVWISKNNNLFEEDL